MYFQQHGPVRFPVRFRFVFSTGTYFQQLLGFVFGFVWVRFWCRSFIINNFSGSFFKITSFLVPFVSKSQKTSHPPRSSRACRALQIRRAVQACDQSQRTNPVQPKLLLPAPQPHQQGYHTRPLLSSKFSEFSGQAQTLALQHLCFRGARGSSLVFIPAAPSRSFRRTVTHHSLLPFSPFIPQNSSFTFPRLSSPTQLPWTQISEIHVYSARS